MGSNGVEGERKVRFSTCDRESLHEDVWGTGETTPHILHGSGERIVVKITIRLLYHGNQLLEAVKEEKHL